jgi:two-component system CheB/CheR fusion protein
MQPDEIRSASTMPRSRARRALVADDNGDIVLTLSIMLEMMGFEVHSAANGAEALEVAKAQQPDVLFLDIGMPELDGWEVCRRVRMLMGDAPAVIAVTGYGQDDDRARSLQAGFDAHVTKPLQQDALLGLLSRLSDKIGRAHDAPARDSAAKWSDTDARALAETLLDRSLFHGVIFIDAAERIRGWNRGACHITGFTAADVVGQPASMLFTPEDRARGLADHELRIARDAGLAEDERWHLRKDGSRFWSGGHTMAFRNASGALTGYVKSFRDATHLRTRMKSLENEAQACRAHLSRTDEYLGAIAHELRNPLAPLKSAVHILRLDVANAVDPDLLDVMDRQLDALERRVEDLLDLTRARTGKLRIDPAAVVVQRLVEEAVHDCADAAARARVRVQMLLPEVPLEAVVDGDRIRQTIVNLLGNAIKFTPSGGAAWVVLTADQTHFILQVKDEGRGISAALLPHIFNAFTQAPDAAGARGTGIGLGLSVAKQIAAAHQGTIEVRSEGEGKGSDFTLRIPLQPPDGASAEPLPEAGPPWRAN